MTRNLAGLLNIDIDNLIGAKLRIVAPGGGSQKIRKYSPPADFPTKFLAADILAFTSKFLANELKEDLMSQVGPEAPSHPSYGIHAFNVE
jgi:hypothetical protein